MPDLTTEEGRLSLRQRNAAKAARDVEASASQPNFIQQGLEAVGRIFRSPQLPSVMAPSGDLADVPPAPRLPPEERPDFAALSAGQGPVRSQAQAPAETPVLQAQTPAQAAAGNDTAQLVGQQVNPAELGPEEASAEYGKNYALQTGATTLRGGADFVSALDGLAGMVSKKAGIAKPQIFSQLEDSSLYWAQNLQNRMSFHDYMTDVVGGVLGSAPEVVQFMMGPEWAALKAVGQGEDLPGAIKAYAQRSAAGAVFKSAHTLDAPARIAAGTAYMTGENAAGQLGQNGEIDPRQLAESAGTGLGMMLTGGLGPGDKTGQRQRINPRGWIETSPAGREMDRAFEAGHVDALTRDLAYDFWTSDLVRGGTAFKDTSVNVLDTVKLIRKGVDDAILREQGVDPEKQADGQHIVTGKTTVSPQEDGSYKTAIDLYLGHNAGTFIEEWMHRQYYYLDVRDKTAVQKAYDGYTGSLGEGAQAMSIEEFYAKSATDKFFADQWAAHKAAQRPAFTRAVESARQKFGALVDAVKGIAGANVDEASAEAVRTGAGIEMRPAEHYQAASMYRNPRTDAAQFVDYVRQNAQAKASYLDMGKAPDTPALARAGEVAGADLSGATVVLPSATVQHVDRNHPGTSGEAFASVLKTMSEADAVTPGDARWTSFGGKTVVFSSFADGTGNVVVAEYVKGKRSGERLVVKTAFSDTEKGVRSWLEKQGGGGAEEGLAASGSLADTQARPEGRNDVQDTSSEVNIGTPWENGKTSHQTRDLGSSWPDVVYSALPVPPLDQKYTTDGNLNLRRIEGPEDVKALLNKISEENAASGLTAERTRGKVSQDETAALAADLGLTVDELLARRQGAAYNAEGALAARQLLGASAQTMWGLLEKAKAPGATDAELVDAVKYLRVHALIQAEMSGVAAEAGRALAIFNRPVGTAEDQMRVHGLAKLLDEYGGKENAERVVDAAMSLIELSADGKIDIRVLNKFARDASKATTADMLMEVWINSLLMAPATHIVNSTSNLAVAMWALPERAIAGAIGAVRDKLGRVKDGDRVYVGEALAQAYGAFEGMKDGLRLASRAWINGESADPMGKVETVRRAITAENLGIDPADPFGKALDWMASVVTDGPAPAGARRAARSMRDGLDMAFDHVLRGPTRALMTADELFKAVGYCMELRAQAYRQAASEGLSGQEFNARVQELIDNPTTEIKLASIEAARYQTFTNALGEIGNALMAMKAATHTIETAEGRKVDVPIGLPVNVVVPFVRTPINVIKYGLARTPLGITMPSVWSDIAAGGAKSDLAIARVTVGSMLAASFASLAAQGVITGGGPTDTKQRENLQQTGWQPYSFKIGDTYYQYKRFDPLSTVIGFSADFAQMQEWMADSDKENLAALISTSFAQNVLDRSWMMGVQRALDALADPQRHGDRWIQQTLGGFMPAGAGMRMARAATDPYLREVESVVDAWKNQLPGYSKELYPRRDRYGEPVPAGDYWLAMQGVSPVRTSREQNEDRSVTAEADRIIRDNHVSIPRANKNFHADGVFVPLTGEEYDRLQQISGQETPLVDSLNRLVAAPQFQNMSGGPDGTKAQAIRQVFHEAHEQARDMLYRESVGVPGGLAERLEDARELDRLRKSAQQ